MADKIKALIREARLSMSVPGAKLMYFFALEGMLLQFAISIKTFGNNLFATNLGASDTQIGLIQTIGCGVTVALLLPVGVISDRQKSSKTVPLVLLLLAGAMFILQGLVPFMGAARLALFFVFMGLSSGLFGAYNAQWQSMFGDLVDIRRRNRIYALRNRVMALLGVVAPVLCGVAMTRAGDSEGKLGVLSLFFCLSGALMLVQALVVWRIPGGCRSLAQMEGMERFSMRNLGEAMLEAARNRPFRSFVFTAMLLYTCWQFDWSMWYIGQVQYVLLAEAQLSYFNAICCVLQIFALGFWARMNQKKSVHFTVCVSAVTLALFPIDMLAAVAMPPALRPWVFIIMASLTNVFECAIPMCMVQMLLEAAPERHRSLTVSLYTILTTLSNALLPFLGVRLYNALGGDWRAFRLFFVIEFVWRVGVGAYYVLRYRRLSEERTRQG